jgi:hypothetical protein
MQPIESHIRPTDPLFQANRDRMEQLVAELRTQRASAREGGGAKYVQRHREQGKLPVRERIERLLDPGSPFLELSPLAAFGLYDDEAPAAGIVTGIGRVSGREVVIVANDATVKGGTYFPITVKARSRSKSPDRIACRASTGGLWRCVSSGAGRGVPGSRSFRRISSTRRHVARIPDCRGRGSCRRAAPTCGDVRRRSSSKARGRSSPAVLLVKAATGEEVTAEDSAALTSTPGRLGAPTTSRKTTTPSRSPHHRVDSTRKQLPADMTTPEEPAHDRQLYGVNTDRGVARRSRGDRAHGRRLALTIQGTIRQHPATGFAPADSSSE